MQLSYLVLPVSLCFTACAHPNPVAKSQLEPGQHDAALAAPDAEALGRYNQGLRMLDRGLVQEAIKSFEAIRTEFPYSPYAALSELRVADAYMQRNQYLEAIDAYRTFLRFHPSHPDAAFALDKVGEAYFAQIPKDHVLMPPAQEKDLSHVKDAIATYQDLLSRYPGAEHAATAQKHLNACRKKLADHEMYVARFYFSRSQWAGAALRLHGLLATYPKLGHDADALWMLAQAHEHLGELDQAVASLTQLLADYPDTQAGHRGQNLLQHLEGRMQ